MGTAFQALSSTPGRPEGMESSQQLAVRLQFQLVDFPGGHGVALAQVRYQVDQAGPVAQFEVHLRQQFQHLPVFWRLGAQFVQGRQRLFHLPRLVLQVGLRHADGEVVLRRVLVRQRQVFVAFFAVALALAGHGRAQVIQQRGVAMTHAGEQLCFGLDPVAFRQIRQALDERGVRRACLAFPAPAADVARDAPQAHDHEQQQVEQEKPGDHQRDENRQRHLDAPRRARNQHVTGIVEGVEGDQRRREQQDDDENQRLHGASPCSLRRRKAASDPVMSGISVSNFMDCKRVSSACIAVTTWDSTSK